MSFRTRALALLLAIGFAGTAGAEEVKLGMVGSVRWDTNAFRENARRVNAWRGGVGPSIRVERNERLLSYDARYLARYERTLDAQARDTWEHIGRLIGSWKLGPRTTLDFRDDLVSQERPVFFGPANDPDTLPGADDSDEGTDRTTRNFASATLTHAFTRRWALVGAVSHSLVETSNDRRFDSTGIAGQLYAAYTWTPSTQLNLGASANYTSIDGNDFQPGSRTRTFQVFGGGSYEADRGLRFSITGGPAFVHSQAKRNGNSGQFVPVYRPAGVVGDGAAYAFDSCTEADGGRLFGAYVQTSAGRIGASECPDRIVSGVNGQPLTALGVTDDEFTTISGGSLDKDTVSFFGEASITKEWRDVVARLSYRRSETPSTQSGGSTSLDRVTASILYAPPGPWSLQIVGDWSLRRSLTDQQFTAVPTAQGTGFIETAEDSGLLGLDQDGMVRPIARAGGLVTFTRSNAVDTILWSVLVRLQRRIDDDGSVALDLRYRRVNEKGDVNATGTNGRFVASLTFEYDLHAFEF